MSERPEPAAEPPITLESIARQIEQVFDRLDVIEAQIAVLNGMAIRREAVMTRLATEFREGAADP